MQTGVGTGERPSLQEKEPKGSPKFSKAELGFLISRRCDEPRRQELTSF
jgi:hypothetical protein